MRLLLDMDGVICDQMGGVFRTVKHESGIELCHADTEDYWFKGMTVEPKYLLDIMRRPGYFRSLDVITGAVEAVNRLRSQYDTVVCSAPLSGSPDCEDDKREWLARHFDNDFAEEAIITPDKTKVFGRAIIEDFPDIARDAVWQPIIFTQRWNRHVTDLPRMNGWGDLDVVHGVMQ